ncbi:hypothetical protein ZIOFF_044126 [Zingiber officinale]|uniref:Uncharacterized protein n=1 Tax=Zingiber officinale TaxID=94328 RepID=A0A8J5G0J8_ZINOF|nr:hypothetical protein ZIOFF_044126 [Zingiber officinale]
MSPLTTRAQCRPLAMASLDREALVPRGLLVPPLGAKIIVSSMRSQLGDIIDLSLPSHRRLCRRCLRRSTSLCEPRCPSAIATLSSGWLATTAVNLLQKQVVGSTLVAPSLVPTVAPPGHPFQ